MRIAQSLRLLLYLSSALSHDEVSNRRLVRKALRGFPNNKVSRPRHETEFRPGLAANGFSEVAKPPPAAFWPRSQ